MKSHDEMVEMYKSQLADLTSQRATLQQQVHNLSSEIVTTRARLKGAQRARRLARIKEQQS